MNPLTGNSRKFRPSVGRLPVRCAINAFSINTFQRDPNYKFRMTAKATDRGEKPLSATIDMEITVVESHKKAPTFKEILYPDISINENSSDFTTPIAIITAE